MDGATYYFDKNGSKVTGEQVIEGIPYTFSSEGVRSGTIGIDVSKYQTGIDWTKVKNAGYTPMVYASKSWFSDHLNISQLSGYLIWVAHYAEKCGYTGSYHIWQNTDKGKVDGVPGYIDMNVSSI